MSTASSKPKRISADELAPQQTWWRSAWRMFRSDPGAIIGAIIIFLLFFTAIFAEQIAPHAPGTGSFDVARLPPVWQEGGNPAHILGTDRSGEDIFSRIVYGSRVSLTVGVFGALLAATIGVSLGLVAGYLGGWVDAVITSLVNVILSVPYLVLVIVAAAVLGRSLLNVVLIFGVTGSPVFVRFTRGEVLRLKSMEFIQAAQSLGATTPRIILRHILPNLVGPLATLATFEMSSMIFYEAGLSFLGLSVPPEVPSWGNMLTVGRPLLQSMPWVAIWPGVAIAVTSLGVNLLGDWLRDTLDPRLRKGQG